jgi:2-hydroxy-3-keto-5-methylthiopentenyl-1-phosphate phosphatase
MELDPDLAESVRILQDRGWEVVIASAGCDWYIQRLLKKAGVSVSVHSNPGVFDPERGLQMSLPEHSPFFSATTGVNKVEIVKDALNRSECVAFAGDGRPDLKPALLVKPQLRFARGWLAEALRERGEEFHPFERWSQTRITFRTPHADTETNRHPHLGARKAGSLGSNGRLR